MRILLRLLPASILVATGMQGCKKAPPPGPPPPRLVTISVSSGAAPVGQITGRVVVVPYDEGREKLLQAMGRRRKMEETLRKEEAELEKAMPANFNPGVAGPAEAEPELDRALGAAKRTIESLADLGLIYYEEVASQKGGELPPERLAAFREKLGVDELKRSSGALKAEDLEGTKKAVTAALEVLGRDVYSAERMKQERARTETVLKQLAAALEKAPASTKSVAAGGSPRVPAGNRDVVLRYMNNRATHHQTTDPLAMFTALPNAKITAEIDGDGKATVEVPTHGKWIVAVCFQRPGRDNLSLNFGLSESFCWIQELPADRNQLSLTADNRMRRSVAPLGLEQSVPWR